uniref:H/ACA ribonucleoprotein complex non-core subunit NAF1 n=1 Tax=Fagus sylvatica TaxID=28930 RepID=A0A2N9GTY5_FAGSY
MVGFISEPTIEDLDQVQKLKNSNSPLDPLDQKPTDFTFSDSFLDFDSLKDWFEDIPVARSLFLCLELLLENPIEPVQDPPVLGMADIGAVFEVWNFLLRTPLSLFKTHQYQYQGMVDIGAVFEFGAPLKISIEPVQDPPVPAPPENLIERVQDPPVSSPYLRSPLSLFKTHQYQVWLIWELFLSLEPLLRSPVEPVQDPRVPDVADMGAVFESGAPPEIPSEPVQDPPVPVEPVQDPPVPDVADMGAVFESGAPPEIPTEPVQDPPVPGVVDMGAAVFESGAPLEIPTEPVQDPPVPGVADMGAVFESGAPPEIPLSLFKTHRYQVWLIWELVFESGAPPEIPTEPVQDPPVPGVADMGAVFESGAPPEIPTESVQDPPVPVPDPPVPVPGVADMGAVFESGAPPEISIEPVQDSPVPGVADMGAVFEFGAPPENPIEPVQDPPVLGMSDMIAVFEFGASSEIPIEPVQDPPVSGMVDMGAIFKFGAPLENPIEPVQDPPVPGMADMGTVFEFGAPPKNPIEPIQDPEVGGSVSELKVKVEEQEWENWENLRSCIEEEMGKVGLVVESGNLGIGGGSDVKKEVVSDVDESESSDSESSSSSEAETSSSGSSDDDDDDEEEEEEDKDKKEVKVEVMRGARGGGGIDEDDGKEMVSFSDFDEEEDYEGGAPKGPIKSKHELEVLPPVPPVDATLQLHHQMLPVGVVLSIFGAQVIVEGVEKHNPVSEGSILWITESRSPLGLVDEIFGPVKSPYYKSLPIMCSMTRIFTRKGMMHLVLNDEEELDEAEFSDDEQEAEFKRHFLIEASSSSSMGQGFVIGTGFIPPFPQTAQTIGFNTPSQKPQEQPSNQSQHNFSPSAAFFDRGPSSSSMGQGFAIGTGFIPPFPQTAQTIGFNRPSNGVWTNGMPFQPPHNAVFPNGFPTNGMPWSSQNPNQHPCQMPMPNRMPFQQQFDPSQTHPTAMFPAVGPTYAQGLVGQNGFNQSPFGMGLQGQHTHPSMNMGMNVGDQGILSNGLQFQQNSMQQSAFAPGNVEAAQQFNMGASSHHGRKPYHQGGGRFAGGRGWQQSK